MLIGAILEKAAIVMADKNSLQPLLGVPDFILSLWCLLFAPGLVPLETQDDVNGAG